jgi:flagellar biosynthesis activator protein FlaF
MTLKAYQTTQRAAENPRDAEYRLFGQVTGALIDVHKSRATGGSLVNAVNWNRSLWRTLATDCIDEQNQLSKDVRAKIVSLSLFVNKYSKRVMRNGASVEPLIEINRSIMQGLRGAA